MDIRSQFNIIHEFEEILKESGRDYKSNTNLIRRKRELRKELKKQTQDTWHVIKEYGIDGYIILQEFPDFIRTREDSEEYFKKTWYMICRPSMYDCTGQAFTSWYKIFQRRGKWMVYHSVSFDV